MNASLSRNSVSGPGALRTSLSGARYSTVPPSARAPRCAPGATPRTGNVRPGSPIITPGSASTETPLTPPTLSSVGELSPTTAPDTRAISTWREKPGKSSGR